MLDEIRAALIADTWPGGLPTAADVAVDVGWNGGLKASQPTTVQREDRLTCPLPRGGASYAWLLHPVETMRGRLLLVVGGHGTHYFDPAYGMLDMTLAALQDGYHVLALAMPTQNQNIQPLVLRTVAGGTLSFHGHDFSTAEADGVKALRLFLDPAIIAVRYCLATLGPTTVDAVGFSGGGWTVDWLSAVYRVIRRSASVFGSLPPELRPSGVAGSDWEQSADRAWWDPLKVAGGGFATEVLYAMGQAGSVGGEPGEDVGSLEVGGPRERLQILGADDPEFPAGGIADEVAAYSETVAALSGSTSEVMVDPTNGGLHTFTAWARDHVLAMLE